MVPRWGDLRRCRCLEQARLPRHLLRREPAAKAAAPASHAETFGRETGAAASGDQSNIISKIARPKIILSVLGLLVLLMVGRMLLDSGGEPTPVADNSQTQAPPVKTNEQLIAEHIAEGKTKLAAGDFDAAITAAERALVIDQENPDALALKIKAEEAKRAAPARRQRRPQNRRQDRRPRRRHRRRQRRHPHRLRRHRARRRARSRGKPPSR